MSQKTLSDILRHQTRNAMDWLRQKVPGTEHYTPKDLALDFLIEVIKPGEVYEPYDETRDGYEVAGPNGSAAYIDGMKISHK